jgi:hypothetical protein
MLEVHYTTVGLRMMLAELDSEFISPVGAALMFRRKGFP